MAEVMNEIGTSNGEIDDEKEEIRINGDACDESTSIRKISSDGEEQSKKDKNSTKKLSTTDNHSGDGKRYEQVNLADKNGNAVANGHFKSDAIDISITPTEDGQSSRKNCDNDDSSDIGNDQSSADEQTKIVVENNHEMSMTITKINCDIRLPEGTALNLKSINKDAINDDGGSLDEEPSDLSIELSTVTTSAEKDKCGEIEDEDDDDDAEEDDVISINNTPDRGKKLSKKPSSTPSVSITPRRSSRNISKLQKTFPDFEDNRKRANEDDEIEEVTPTDPLALVEEPKSKIRSNKTIVVSDTKGLVEFASNAKASRSNKKEPTLVIIDTNSILSGRGPIPVSQQSSGSSLLHSSSASAPIPVSLPIAAGAFANATRGTTTSSTSAFSVIPIGLPAQGMYSQFKNPPPQIKPIVVGPASTTVTPVPLPTTTNASTTVTPVTTTSSPKQPPVILPSLTDDMFVVEAPSFIVPYVYEKPPMRSLKEHIDKIQIDLKEAEEKERKERESESAKEASDDTEKDDDDEAEKSDSAVSSTESEKPVKDSGADKDAEKDGDQSMEVDEENDSTSTKASLETDGKKMDEKKDDASALALTKDGEKKIMTDDAKKPASYFENPLGKFFMQIGLNLVQEHVQTDLLRSQKRKRDKEGNKCSPDINSAIDELTKTLESSKENNDPFKLELKKCELCSFKTESLLVMAHHLETPHMKNYTYRCNFCPMEVRSPHDILFHMEAEHNIRGRLERAPAFHQCPNCPFEDNQKGKLTRHLISCSKKYRPERNQEPPLDWEPPAKIPRVTRNRPPSMSPGNAVYQAAMSGLKQVPQNTLLPKLMPNTANMKHNMLNSAKRPNLAGNFVNRYPSTNTQPNFQQRPISVQTSNQGMMYRATSGSNSQTQVLLPQGYQLSGAQIYQNQGTKQQTQQGLAAAKLLNQPSISITPLPRQTSSTSASSSSSTSGNVKPGKPTTNAGGKSTFVVCEICDGYIKDLDQLRNHMQWIHKVKIHPKMIYNRPPLNCQKCQFRFFTDQGLERHLLGSHGLVTSSMQEAANKGKDGGRCPVCGRVYQWKLLNHVARDHQMALKPAHLSYKCTVCTATFGMYKQFESHVYSAHSVVAKRAMDTGKKPPISQPSSQNDTLLKPLKINDEITIIPQPIRSTKPSSKGASAATISATVTKSKNVEDNVFCKCACLPEDFASNAEFRQHVCEKHLKNFQIKITRIDLKAFNKIPNKENAFRVENEPLTMDELRERFSLKDFHIKIKRQRWTDEHVYEIPDDDKMASTYLIPDLQYGVENENEIVTLKTLYVQRMAKLLETPGSSRSRKRNTNTNAARKKNSANKQQESDHFLGALCFQNVDQNLVDASADQTKDVICIDDVREVETVERARMTANADDKGQRMNLASKNIYVDLTRFTKVTTVAGIRPTFVRPQIAVRKPMIRIRPPFTTPRLMFNSHPAPVIANVFSGSAMNFSNRPKTTPPKFTSVFKRPVNEMTRCASNLQPKPQNDVISLLSDSDRESSDDSEVEIVDGGENVEANPPEEYILPV